MPSLRLGVPGAVVATLAGYFLLLAVLGGQPGWDRLGVPDLQPSFADLRSVTSAWECDRQGTPVLPVNPCDPYGGRPANYPSLWLAPSGLGLGQGSTVALGVASAVVFLVSLLFLLSRARARGRLLCAAVAISPGVMLGVERGNVDILLFAVVVAALALFRRSPAARVAGEAMLLGAALLKLFPVFAWGVLLRQPRRPAIASILLIGAAFAIYVVATADTIRAIERAVPQNVGFSYGADVGFDSLGAGDWPTRFALAAAVIAIALLARGRTALADAGGERDRHARFALDAFVAGAGVYVASFALGHNYDYRMVFVLLALPQLTLWAHERAIGGPAPVPAPRLTLAALVASLWLSLPLNAAIGFWIGPLEFLTLDQLGFSIDELANWTLFVGLGTGLVAVLAPAVQALLRKRREPSPQAPRPRRLRRLRPSG